MRARHRAAARGVTGIVAAVAAGALALAGCTGGGSGDRQDGGSPPGHSPRAKASTGTGETGAGEAGEQEKAAARKPRSIAALGDSITAGFHACGPLSDCPRVSWSTGTDPDVDSLARRLLDEPSGSTWNFARSGAQMADLPAQTEEAVSRRPDLVTVLIGANDACVPGAEAMTPVPDFRASFAASLERLERELPRTRVYVSSVPSLLRLWEVGHDNPLTRQIWSLGICQSMLADSGSLAAVATDRRTRVQERVVEYNAVLEEECGEHPLCVYDDGATFAYDFTAGHLSRWDSFHPDEEGQHALAEIAYRRLREERGA